MSVAVVSTRVTAHRIMSFAAKTVSVKSAMSATVVLLTAVPVVSDMPEVLITSEIVGIAVPFTLAQNLTVFVPVAAVAQME